MRRAIEVSIYRLRSKATILRPFAIRFGRAFDDRRNRPRDDPTARLLIDDQDDVRGKGRGCASDRSLKRVASVRVFRQCRVPSVNCYVNLAVTSLRDFEVSEIESCWQLAKREAVARR